MAIIKKNKLTASQQIKMALDGRTNRWLALRSFMPESELSRKLNDKIAFTNDEIERINTVLKTSITI